MVQGAFIINLLASAKCACQLLMHCCVCKIVQNSEQAAVDEVAVTYQKKKEDRKEQGGKKNCSVSTQTNQDDEHTHASFHEAELAAPVRGDIGQHQRDPF